MELKGGRGGRGEFLDSRGKVQQSFSAFYANSILDWFLHAVRYLVLPSNYRMYAEKMDAIFYQSSLANSRTIELRNCKLS